MQSFLIQIFHHFSYILGLLARGDEESVIRLYDYQIIHPDGGDEFTRCVNVISRCVESESAFARDQIPV